MPLQHVPVPQQLVVRAGVPQHVAPGTRAGDSGPIPSQATVLFFGADQDSLINLGRIRYFRMAKSTCLAVEDIVQM